VEPSVEAVAEDERFRVRGFMEGGVIVFNARESFQALFGGSSGGAFGGGLELQYRRFFLRAGVERVAKTGERVFVFEGEVFPLAIEDKVTITPLSAVVGYRFARLGPATLFAGAGVGSYKLTETAVLGDVSESVEERFTGFQGLVGAEFRINRWIGVAADVQYATVPRSLGTGGVSEVFAEEDLGGLGFRLHVLVGP
jgi:opacity protein-like surface antigen